MNIKVYQNRDTHQIDNDVYGTQNENNVTELKIEVPEQYENWNKRIVFITPDGNFEDIIENNTYILTKEITKYEEVEAYIWLTEKADTTEESIGDFRSKTFPLSFYLNENPNTEAPTDKQIDIYNSLLTALNVEIEEVKQINKDFTKLKQDVEQSESSRNTSEKAREKAETERATAESIRKKNESDRIINENGRAEAENSRNNEEETRQANESKRIANESARKLAEENREKTTKEAVNNIKDLSASYEQLAKEKETELNTHKTTLETEMTNTKDNLVQEIETAQNGFDENATLKKIAFNNNVTEQTNTFNTNAETKTNDFNTNASTKQTEYDDNATSKLEEYNSNSTAKVNEFNENAESYEKRIAELETERDEVAQQMPWNTTDISESIHIEDSAKYSRNKLDVFGNLKQKTRSGKNKFNAKEKLNASTTKNNITYTKNADNTFDISGTASANTLINVATVTDIIQRAKSYYLYSSKEYNLATFNLSIVVKYSDGDTQYIGANKSNVTTLTDKEIKSATLDFYAAEGITVNASNVKIMLVESDTVDNEFEEYGAMPSIDYPSIPVVATGVQKIRRYGKNFFNVNDIKALVNAKQDGTKIISAITKNTITINTNAGSLAQNEQVLKAKKYTLSFDIISSVTNQIKNLYLCTYNLKSKAKNYKNEVKLKINANESTRIKTIFNLTEDTLKTGIALYFINKFNADEITIQNIQIEEGDTATEYEPYNGEDITLDLGTTELCKITDADGNVVAQDRAVYREVDGIWKWQWEKNITKIILNGTEIWKLDPLRPNCNYRSFYTPKKYIKEDSFIISNLLKNNIEIYNNDYLGIYVNWDSSIRIKNGVSTTVEELQTWLSANNLTCYVVLKLQKYEDCTAEQSEVLDKLYKLQLEKGTNNIFVESENGVTTELQLTYMQDLQSKLNQLESMILSNASEEV